VSERLYCGLTAVAQSGFYTVLFRKVSKIDHGFGAVLSDIADDRCPSRQIEDPPNMHLVDEACTVCRTTMELLDTQPIDEQYEVIFFKCPLCAKSSQIATTYSKLVPID
jgi:hypothetical protein